MLKTRLEELLESGDRQAAIQFARGAIANQDITNISVNKSQKVITFSANDFTGKYTLKYTDGKVVLDDIGIYEIELESGTFTVQMHSKPDELQKEVEQINDELDTSTDSDNNDDTEQPAKLEATTTGPSDEIQSRSVLERIRSIIAD